MSTEQVPIKITLRGITEAQAREQASKEWEAGVFDGMGFHEFCKRIDFRYSDPALLDAYLDELIELRDK